MGRIGQTAVEVKGCADGYLHSVLEVWLQTVHELLLLGGAKGNPNDVGTVLFNHSGYAGVVELIDSAEWQFLECHAQYIGVLFCKVLLQGVEYVLLGAKEYHAVLACTHNIDEDVATTIVGTLVSVYPLYKLGHPTAVTNGEYAAVNDGAVLFVAVHHGEYVAVGNTYIAGFAIGNALVNGGMDGWYVEFVSYVEVFFHSVVFVLSAKVIIILLITNLNVKKICGLMVPDEKNLAPLINGANEVGYGYCP